MGSATVFVLGGSIPPRFLQGRTRRIAIVAIARKLLSALWHYVDSGVIPNGVKIRAQQVGRTHGAAPPWMRHPG